jgi:HNH endonuclease
MEAELVRLVWQRAEECCEYCRMHQQSEGLTFEIYHIISQKHRGPSTASNLALSCFYCNSYKGTDIAARDRVTRKLAPLFNPRRHKWSRHFRWEGGYLVGRTPIGRVTVVLLKINNPNRVKLREGLIEEGLFPPE